MNLICLELIPEIRQDITIPWYYLTSYEQPWFWPNLADWGVVESSDGFRRIYTLSWKDQNCYNNTQGDPIFQSQLQIWQNYNSQNNIIRNSSYFQIINYNKVQDAVNQVKMAAANLLG